MISFCETRFIFKQFHQDISHHSIFFFGSHSISFKYLWCCLSLSRKAHEMFSVLYSWLWYGTFKYRIRVYQFRRRRHRFCRQQTSFCTHYKLGLNGAKIHSNIRLIEREKLTHTLTFNVIVNSTYLYNVHLTIKHNKKNSMQKY